MIIYDESPTLSGRHLARSDLRGTDQRLHGRPGSRRRLRRRPRQFTDVRFLGLPINRMTRHLYDDLEPFAKSAAEKVYDGNLGSALGCLRQKIRFVQGDPVTGRNLGYLYHPTEAVACPQTKSATGPPCTRKTSNRVRKCESGRKTSRSLFLLGEELSGGWLDLLEGLLRCSRRCLLF